MRTRPLRIYADTSVFGGVLDDEFREPSATFFTQVEQGRVHLVTSPAVLAELGEAPQEVLARIIHEVNNPAPEHYSSLP
jgi:predicted nucleic acid-binding protein